MGAFVLTDIQARKAQPRDKDYKLADAGGLYLFISAKGAKSWRLKYRFGGKEKRLVFGQYPEIPLIEARELRDDARRAIRENRDPAVEKRKQKLAAAAAAIETFEKLARAWHSLQAPRWARVHAADVITSLENDVFPDLGRLPIPAIDGPVILATLRKVEARGSIETARRLRQRISAIFGYAVSEGIASHDPALGIVKALKPMPKRGRQPALTAVEDLRALLVKSEASGATPVVKLASRLLALTAVRPGVIRGVQWEEFEQIDWESPEPSTGSSPLWRIPASRMKLILDRKGEDTFEHLVPLSRQAVAVLRAMRQFTGRNKLVFPSQRYAHRPMSENAIGYLYNRVGFHGQHVPHGWRAAFSTIMNEKAERDARAAGQRLLAELDARVIDLMLAHVKKDRVEAAYNRAAFMDRRIEIAQEWADMLSDGLAEPSTLLEGRRR